MSLEFDCWAAQNCIDKMLNIRVIQFRADLARSRKLGHQMWLVEQSALIAEIERRALSVAACNQAKYRTPLSLPAANLVEN